MSAQAVRAVPLAEGAGDGRAETAGMDGRGAGSCAGCVPLNGVRLGRVRRARVRAAVCGGAPPGTVFS